MATIRERKTSDGEKRFFVEIRRRGSRPIRRTFRRKTAARSRTLLHELCHHLGVEQLKLDRTLHTPAFFRRESSLVRQVLGELGDNRSH